MRIQWAVLARYAEVVDGSITVIGAGIDAFVRPEFPATVQAFIAIQFRLLEHEASGDLPVTLTVRDRDLEVVGEPIPLRIGPVGVNPNHPPGWEVGAPVTGPFAVQIDEPGSFDLAIDSGDGKPWQIPFSAFGPPAS